MKKFRMIALISLLCCFLSSCGFIPLQFEEENQTGCVTLYEHRDFQGESLRVCESQNLLDRDFNDRVSSLRIDCDLRAVTLFEHRDYGGRNMTFSGCREINYLGNEFNDQLSSIIIYKR